MSCLPEVFAAGGGCLWDSEERELRGIEIISAIPHSHVYFCGFKMLSPEIWKAEKDSIREDEGASKKSII